MMAVISRVTGASVTAEGEVVGALPGPGLLALVGVSADDDERDVETMVRKIAELRILAGERSAVDVGAPVLVVSQFTLLGSTAKGRRPSWSRAARGDVAEPMVESVVLGLRERGLEVATGAFGAMMQVHSTNDGPFTVLVETSTSQRLLSGPRASPLVGCSGADVIPGTFPDPWPLYGYVTVTRTRHDPPTHNRPPDTVPPDRQEEET